MFTDQSGSVSGYLIGDPAAARHEFSSQLSVFSSQ